MQLECGSRVIIIGGGPAGSFSALHLLTQAAAVGLDLQVTILEPRDFSRPGLSACNKCAGILSSPLIHKLNRLGLKLPPEVIQTTVDTYILHSGQQVLPIHIDDPQRHVITVYRGGGPRLGSKPYPRSFDAWLLHQAVDRGVRVLPSRALSIQTGDTEGAPLVVITPESRLEADLVILATGINGHITIDPALGYIPPRTEVMAQDEIQLPGELFARSVHIFFDHPDGLIFGALIPKNRYVNISLLGHKLPVDAVAQFLSHNQLSQQLPAEMISLCGCAPKISISPARGYFADRFVAVGDAAVTRLYKDGIGSAFVTAEAAAACAVQRGISRDAFAASYLPACQRIDKDNAFGRLLFGLWALIRKFPGIRSAWIQATLNEVDLPMHQRIHSPILWGMLSGDESYRAMFWRSISLPSMLSILKSLTASLFSPEKHHETN